MIDHGNSARTLSVMGLLAALLAVGLALAGDLEPPGPPGPTMKPLPELEPRTPIFAHQLPLTITEPGSYYLAENIVTTGDGITIDASDVTLDLGGFTLEGGTGIGIHSTDPHFNWHENIVVRNGVVTSWDSHGVYLESSHSTVEGVIAHDNGGTGIHVEVGSRVSGCAANENTLQGIEAQEQGSLVESSVAYDNDENGILVHQGVMVRGCVSSYNYKNGIRASTSCFIVGNECTSNGQGAAGKAGILVLGTDNRIDGNHLSSNSVGIQVDDADNIIVRNTLLNNPTRDIIASGNDVGPWGTAATATSPWANIWKP